MSEKYKVANNRSVYFITITIIGWVGCKYSSAENYMGEKGVLKIELII